MTDAALTNVSRTPKKDPRDVINYEITMLMHCFEGLRRRHADKNVSNLYIEGYLLHYRNLTEFFGASPPPPKGKRATDMSIHRSSTWGTRTLATAEVASVTSLAAPLHEKWKDHIGQQLHHCTEPRFTSKHSWPIADMHADMCAVISAFRALGAPATPSATAL